MAAETLRLVEGGGERDVESIEDIRALADLARKVGIPADNDFHSEEIGDMLYQIGEMAYARGNTTSDVLASFLVASCRFAIAHNLPMVEEWPKIISEAMRRQIQNA